MIANTYKITEDHHRQLIQADGWALLGMLVSDLAHQIDNPNNLIMFNSDLLAQITREIVPILDDYFVRHPGLTLGGLPYKETHDQLEVLLHGIEKGSQRIRDIVAGLKEFSRIESGAARRVFRINDAVKSSLLIADNLTKKHTDQCSVEYADDIPLVQGDVRRIEQVIINLVANSCQALPDRTRALRLRTIFAEGKRRAVIEISDEGCGISKENMKRIFDPFFTTKRESGGTGLGLTVSLAIVQAHGGELLIDSVEGKGTTATIRLPVDAPEETGR